jgi:hypothetical protein
MTRTTTAFANTAIEPCLRQGPIRMRLEPIIRLSDGMPDGMNARIDPAHEDMCTFRTGPSDGYVSAAAWTRVAIEMSIDLANERGEELRPISILLPMAALKDPDLALACEAGASRVRALPQEIRLDVLDGPLWAEGAEGFDVLERLRKRGFRLGLDARQSWRTPMGALARELFEAVRVSSQDLAHAEDGLATKVEASAAAGIKIIAENARWQDAARLLGQGVGYALAPRADA